MSNLPPLRFGMNLTATHSAQSPPDLQITEHRESVALAKDVGFDLIIAGQHFASPELRYFQPVPYLASLTEAAEGMRLAVGIIVLPLHHPLTVAEDIATLDALTGGRAVLGVGIGYSDREFAAFGVDRKTRTTKFEQSVDIVRRLLVGESVHEHTEFFRLDGVRSSTLPAGGDGLPIWIGAQAGKSVRRAARIGDGWYVPPFPTHGELIDLWKAFREERQRTGRADPADFPVRREVFIADSKAEAREALALAEQRYSIYTSWGLDLEKGQGEVDWRDSRFIVGDPRHVAERLLELRAQVPMTHLVFKPQWLGRAHREAMGQLERFGNEVVPLLRDSEPARSQLRGGPSADVPAGLEAGAS